MSEQNHQNVKQYGCRSGPTIWVQNFLQRLSADNKVATNVERVYKDNVYGVTVFKIVIWGGI